MRPPPVPQQEGDGSGPVTPTTPTMPHTPTTPGGQPGVQPGVQPGNHTFSLSFPNEFLLQLDYL